MIQYKSCIFGSPFEGHPVDWTHFEGHPVNWVSFRKTSGKLLILSRKSRYTSMGVDDATVDLASHPRTIGAGSSPQCQHTKNVELKIRTNYEEAREKPRLRYPHLIGEVSTWGGPNRNLACS